MARSDRVESMGGGAPSGIGSRAAARVKVNTEVKPYQKGGQSKTVKVIPAGSKPLTRPNVPFSPQAPRSQADIRRMEPATKTSGLTGRPIGQMDHQGGHGGISGVELGGGAGREQTR